MPGPRLPRPGGSEFSPEFGGVLFLVWGCCGGVGLVWGFFFFFLWFPARFFLVDPTFSGVRTLAAV